MTLFDQIPGYREAVEQERMDRDCAFAALPEDICGIPVRPLSWRLLTRLTIMGSPFICGGNIGPTDAAAALWVISTAYRPRASVRRFVFIRRMRRKKFLALVEKLREYIATALMDAPIGEGAETNTVPFMSSSAAIVDVFAAEYGWSADQVLDAPLAQVFQLLRAIRARHGTDSFWNPSDRVRGQWLATVNQGQN